MKHFSLLLPFYATFKQVRRGSDFENEMPFGRIHIQPLIKTAIKSCLWSPKAEAQEVKVPKFTKQMRDSISCPTFTLKLPPQYSLLSDENPVHL